jgi:hypothetical protein
MICLYTKNSIQISSQNINDLANKNALSIYFYLWTVILFI